MIEDYFGENMGHPCKHRNKTTDHRGSQHAPVKTSTAITSKATQATVVTTTVIKKTNQSFILDEDHSDDEEKFRDDSLRVNVNKTRNGC